MTPPPVPTPDEVPPSKTVPPVDSVAVLPVKLDTDPVGPEETIGPKLSPPRIVRPMLMGAVVTVLTPLVD